MRAQKRIKKFIARHECFEGSRSYAYQTSLSQQHQQQSLALKRAALSSSVLRVTDSLSRARALCCVIEFR